MGSIDSRPSPKGEALADGAVAASHAATQEPGTDNSRGGGDGLEPIAIVGMACHLPGDITSPTGLWETIMARHIANTAKVPPERFNVDAYLHENNERPGSFNVPGGYFLREDPRDFDPDLFDISPIEAAWLDPQQRKLLEVVYEAFENAGCTLDQVASEVTGCFAATFTSDFQQMAFKEPDFRHAYAATGVDPGVLGNRISHAFDLRGPSFTINTACSSSMFALHSACIAIRNGDCEAAVVGGSNLILTVDQHINTAELGVLSPTNQCHSFDDAADGYGRAEGVGALYVKRLDLAVKNGDPIRAVIRSTATNANGKGTVNGMTFPSVQGQVDVITTAYSLGNLDPKLTAYVECHGTGTPTGDPIETHAISQAMRGDGKSTLPILIGSVKPNVGHSEASSSISTIMKSVLAIENDLIPPTAGLVTPNKNVKWDEWQLKVVTQPTPFPPSQPIRRIGVSAFGYGGTNSHTVIDNVESVVPNYRNHASLTRAVPYTNSAHDGSEERSHLLVFSAHDKPTLKRNLEVYSTIGAKVDLLDLSYTLGCRRTKHSCRAFTVTKRQTYSTSVQDSFENTIEHSGPSAVAFVFTGQGAQWPTMGYQLFKLYPATFGKSIHDLDSYLKTLLDGPTWSIHAALSEPGATSRVYDAEFSQPLCTAVQIGLVDLLRSWGVNPVAAVGHSSGEIAAAYAAGLISAKAAIAAAYYRGKVVQSIDLDGAMLAVGLNAQDVLPYIEGYDGKIVVACHNSPSSITLSGDSASISEVKGVLASASVFAALLKTGGKAYHSYQMNDAALRYKQYLDTSASTAPPNSAQKRFCQMVSSVTGNPMPFQTPNDDYWTENLLRPVLFSQAVQKMLTSHPDINIVVEVGPHSALEGPLRQLFIEKKLAGISYLPTLVRNGDDADRLLELAGNLWLRNADIDMAAVTKVEAPPGPGSAAVTQGRLLVDLPPYQWTYKKKLSLESRNSAGHRNQKHPRHDILGRRVIGLSDTEPIWRNILRNKDLPWLKHHSLGGETVFPAAGYFALAIEAITQLNSDAEFPQEITGYTLRDISISVAMVVPDDNEGVETLFSIRRSPTKSSTPEKGISDDWYSFTVSSNSYGTWKEHSKGTVAINKRSRGRTPTTMPDLPVHSPYKAWAEHLRSFGFDFGPTFHNTTELRTDGSTYAAASDIVIRQKCGIVTGESRYAIHPGCLDSCLQLHIPAMYAGKLGDVTHGVVPTHFGEVTIWPPAEHQLEDRNATARILISKRGNRSVLTDSQIVAPDGELIADFSNVRSVLYDVATLSHSQGNIRRQPYMCMEWKPVPEYLDSSNDAVAISASDPEEPINKSQVPPTNGTSHKLASRSILLVYRRQETPFLHSLEQEYVDQGWTVLKSAIADVEQQAYQHVVMLADLEGPILSSIEDAEFKGLQHMTKTAKCIIWVSCGGLLSASSKPEYGMSLGWSRSVRSEHQDLDLVTVDFDLDVSPKEQVIRLLFDVATRQAINGRNDENEYRIDRGIVHVSRLVPAKTINEAFAPGKAEPKPVTLNESPILKGILQSGKVFFQADDRVETALDSDQVEIKVMAVGASKEASLVVSGFDDSMTFNQEIAGTITQVGSEVSDLRAGQRVVAFASDIFSTYQRTSWKLVQRIEDSDPFSEMATLPVAFATALYGLYDLARVEEGEDVLIIDGSDSPGLAAIQLCRVANANAIIVTTSEMTKSMLLSSDFPEENIIIPDKEDVLVQIQRVTASRGPSIIIASGSSEPSLVDECSRSLAPFGRLVMFGKQEGLIPNLSNMPRGSSVFTFDLRDLYQERPQILSRLLAKCMSLYKENKISAIEPLVIRDPSEINEVMTSFQSELGSGKVVVAYEPTSQFKVLQTRPTLKLRPDATYLLIGCLGGLGRCLASWMAEKGARHLAFMSRSGTENPAAAALVESIQAMGVQVTILRANVASKGDVEAAISQIDPRYPVRGIVNAAVFLQDKYFQNMSAESFRQVQEPKYKGSLILHEAFSKKNELDFFVMTSSTSACLGSTGQSNYAAANSYMDALASHRRAQGLPAVSLVLPMVLGVGYVAENPFIEASLRRKGMYGIYEAEMLAAFEVSMTPESTWDHVVAGMEASKLAKAISATHAGLFWPDQARFRILSTAMDEYTQKEITASHDSILTTIESAKSAEDGERAISAYLTAGLSRLLMISAEEFNSKTRSIASYGLDSMIGAEFRSWVFREFNVDVPFQQLLAANLTIPRFAGDLFERCTAGSGEVAVE